ncbi:uncharacterized protein [Battus philenor]|uniref:uncharacterized protein n=1 Tax=Battus philenor TaxID=42288 RepID=UPI0035D137F3
MKLLAHITLLCCTYLAFASEHTHIIPVEKYDTELQELGQHVEIPETPVRVVKITKTIAVKIPVPYPVKVIEKVPYPVHVSKPYPVPVPQIVKVPQVLHPKEKSVHESLDSLSYQGHQLGGNTYQVQEHPSSDSGQYQSYNDDGFEGAQSHGIDYPGNHENVNSFESSNYDQNIQNYLDKFGQGKGNLHY